MSSLGPVSALSQVNLVGGGELVCRCVRTGPVDLRPKTVTFGDPRGTLSGEPGRRLPVLSEGVRTPARPCRHAQQQQIEVSGTTVFARWPAPGPSRIPYTLSLPGMWSTVYDSCLGRGRGRRARARARCLGRPHAGGLHCSTQSKAAVQHGARVVRWIPSPRLVRRGPSREACAARCRRSPGYG